MLSPTVQSGDTPGDGNDDGPGGGGGSDDGRWNGSYHCNKHKERSNCDVCSYMNETSYVTSYYFRKEDLQFMVETFIYLQHRRTRKDGSFT